jgi:hypothetical protein
MRYPACAIPAAAVCGCGEKSRVTQPRLESAATALVAGYEVTRLPSLGGTQSRGMSAQDINDDGRITGRVRDG